MARLNNILRDKHYNSEKCPGSYLQLLNADGYRRQKYVPSGAETSYEEADPYQNKKPNYSPYYTTQATTFAFTHR